MNGKSKAWALALLVAVFLLGGVAGAAVDRMLVGDREVSSGERGRSGGDRDRRRSYTDWLAAELSLTDEQRGVAQVLRHDIGFRTVEVRDGRLLLNGVAVTLKGVNRHEHSPANGRFLSDSLMMLDIRLMKSLNINKSIFFRI